MTSPDQSQATSKPVVPPVTPVQSGTQNPSARPTGAHNAAPSHSPSIDAQGRGGRNGPGDASRSSGTESHKGAGQAGTGEHRGNGGGLRLAVQELASSIECLCNDSGSKDSSGAKHHLEQARRLLGSASRESESRSAAGISSPASTVPAVRNGGTDDDVQKDLQRAMR